MQKMFKLHKIGERTYYIEAPTNIGIYLYDSNKVCMIDSGGDSTAAAEALKIIEQQGWQVGMVLNTHSHADHIGGSAYIKEHTGCKVYAPGVDAAILKHSFLNSVYLYGGFTMDGLRSKFIFAQPCDCEELSPAVLPEGLSYIHVNGHSFEMAAFKTSDDVWFLADSVLDAPTLDRYKITFLYDIEEHLRTLQKVQQLSGKLFIPSHSEPVSDINPLAEKNRRTIDEVTEVIKRFCTEPLSVDELVSKLLAEFNIKLYLTQYALIGFTTRSYISWLCDKGEMEPVFDGTSLKWKTK